MKYLSTIISLIIAGSVFGQDIYWTGNRDAWGGGDHNNFSTEPGGTEYVRLYGSDNAPEPQVFHHHYDENVLAQPELNVSMNRIGQTILSMNITSATPDSGFRFDTTEENSVDIVLSGPVNVHSGIHNAFNAGGIAGITLTQDAVWTVAEGAKMTWRIPLPGLTGGESLTKNGGGTLLLNGMTTGYTGQTLVNEGSFGGSATLSGTLHFAAGTNYSFSPFATTVVNGTVSFDSFGIENVDNLSADSALGTYPIMTGNVNTANLRNLGEANAVDLGDDIRAWFDLTGDVLSLVVNAPAMWAHFPIVNEIGDVDTGGLMGWINVSHGDWVYSYDFGTWVHLPEERVILGLGAWGLVMEGN